MRRLFCGLLLMLAAMPAAGDILNVPGDFPTIQAAMDAAQDGDEIVLAPGVYSDPAISIAPFGLSVITIRSADPADPATVAATILFDPEDDPLIDASIEQPGSLTLDGLTLRRLAARADQPSILVVDGDVTIRRCILDGGTGPASGSGPAFQAFEGNSDGTGQMTVRFEDTEFVGQVGLVVIRAPKIIFDGVTTINGTGSEGFELNNSDPLGGFEIRNAWITAPMSIGKTMGPPVVFVDTVFADANGEVLNIRGSADMTRMLFLRVGRNDNSSTPPITIRNDLTANDLSIVDSGNDNTAFLMNITGNTVVDGMDLDGNKALFVVFHAAPNGGPVDRVAADIQNLIATDNTAANGIVEWYGNGVVRNSTFRRNRGQVIGLFSRNATDRFLRDVEILIENCVFEHNNIAELGDGSSPIGSIGQRLLSGQIRVFNSEIRGNRSSSAGAIGLVEVLDNGKTSVVLDQCLIVGNTGSIAPVHLGRTTYRNSVIIDNATPDGSTRLGLGDAELINTIVSDRFPDAPAVDTNPFAFEPMPAVLSVTASLVGPTNFGQGSSSLNPLFVRNPSDGGDGWGDDPDTPDIDESLNDDFGDLRLSPGSPAIDAGTNDFYTPGDVDLDGNPRLADDPGIPGVNVDIGAYEFQGTTCLPDVNQDGMATPADFTAWITAFNDTSPLADQNRDGAVSPADFSQWILNYNTGCP